MSQFFLVCELGIESGRVVLGTLNDGELTVSEVRRFPNVPIQAEDCIQWDIATLHQEIVEGLRVAGAYEEPVNAISCTSWPHDYLLFDSEGTLMPPAYHFADERSKAGERNLLEQLSPETIYEETGIADTAGSMLAQLAAEPSKRLKKANCVLPVADAFNFLLSGVARAELSLASASQLYNPVTEAWSERLLTRLELPQKLFPTVVPAGTELGALHPELVTDTKLDGARVLAGCSHPLAAAMTAVPAGTEQSWAFVQPGSWTVFGCQIEDVLVNEASRVLQFSHLLGHSDTVWYHKRSVGLWILEECQRFWQEQDRGLDNDLLSHLAGSAPPFQSLIDPSDPRFATPGDMPLKIQAFCKETNQPIPRKPGPVFRCILESLALGYRKMLLEMAQLTGKGLQTVYMLGPSNNTLLNHFLANALRVPVVVMPAEASAIGNIVIQALAVGQLSSLEHAQAVLRRSFSFESSIPHATAWDAACERFEALKATLQQDLPAAELTASSPP